MDQSPNQKLLKTILLDPNIKHLLNSTVPKDLALIRLGIFRVDGTINQTQAKKLAKYIHQHKADAPDFAALERL